jgi:hypothetical protein
MLQYDFLKDIVHLVFGDFTIAVFIYYSKELLDISISDASLSVHAGKSIRNNGLHLREVQYSIFVCVILHEYVINGKTQLLLCRYNAHMSLLLDGLTCQSH